MFFFRNIIPKLSGRVPSLQADLLAANNAAISAFENYQSWLRDSVLPHANGDFAVGCDTYRQFLSAECHLTYSPDDLVRLAECIILETEETIREVTASIDPSVTRQELLARLKRDHPPKDSLVDAYRNAMESARNFVIERDLATIQPDEHLEVAEMPEFERNILPLAAYCPPAPFETSKKGWLWVTPIDDHAPKDQQEAQLRGHCIYNIPIIALHEGYPGHHLQLIRTIELKSAIRKQAANSLLMEGWAYYCEGMMQEQGFYTDPRVHLFQLRDLLWRACRVIIDVGLHTGEMKFDEAVKILVNTAHMEEMEAISEVKRYTTSPTQPMTYAIGKLLVLDLRERMKQKMGSNFRLKAFHDQLLSYGSIPPGLIIQAMTADSPGDGQTASPKHSG